LPAEGSVMDLPVVFEKGVLGLGLLVGLPRDRV
jgi:hypothetical protein